ncbi:RidA family protein [Serinibacter salmoneus]|uniref:Enamine deaminase RidA (YjgF/YER057c/UK114 family) n=1 Tax=Serinibacter salmoneus TaxID=556530 RepID=A0A2A9D225_9MICO|nr:RidA family protein [Serinibacter salmoneus]PFG20747.1 enamine deaminase RidA (YjgF/YER057c/UK114 family) [Serinibacter salmoneus]
MGAESTPSLRLAELGLALPPVAAPVAAYVPAVSAGDLIYSSGQLPLRDGALLATGKVGTGASLVPPEDAALLARTAGLNALAAIAAQAGGLDAIAEIVKTVVFVASDPAFTGQPAVANGASELFGAVFGTPHARSAVGVSVLPLDSPVEVEVIARRR